MYAESYRKQVYDVQTVRKIQPSDATTVKSGLIDEGALVWAHTLGGSRCDLRCCEARIPTSDATQRCCTSWVFSLLASFPSCLVPFAGASQVVTA